MDWYIIDWIGSDYSQNILKWFLIYLIPFIFAVFANSRVIWTLWTLVSIVSTNNTKKSTNYSAQISRSCLPIHK